MQYIIHYRQRPDQAEMQRVLHQFDETPDWTIVPVGRGGYDLHIRTRREQPEFKLFEQRRATIRTHDWATLDGENYSCTWCDTKTGLEVCPASRPKRDQALPRLASGLWFGEEIT